MVKIDFEFDTDYGKFRDALHLDDNHNLTEEEIESMKQERVNNWISLITAPAEEEISNITEEIIDVTDTSNPT